MKKYGFGVDIGGTTCKIGLFHTTGEIIEKWEIPTNTQDQGKNILTDIAASLNQKLSQKNIAKEEIEGIGIGLPGPVRADGVVPVCVNLGWKNLNVSQEMQELMDGIRAEAGNDANVAALGGRSRLAQALGAESLLMKRLCLAVMGLGVRLGISR